MNHLGEAGKVKSWVTQTLGETQSWEQKGSVWSCPALAASDTGFFRRVSKCED